MGGRPSATCRRRGRIAAAVVASADQGSPATSKRRHSPGMPLSECDPRSANSMAEPTTRSFTVPDTSTQPTGASAMTRAAMWTAIPAIRPSWISTSPLCNPARISIPSDRTAICDLRSAPYRPSRSVEGR